MGQDNGSRRSLWLCLAVCLVLVGMAFYVAFGPSKKEEPKPVVTDISRSVEAESGTLLVYVVGAVKAPGVYELPQGSRFSDAVKAAGDVLPYADMDSINMAEPVTDGMKIYISLDPEQADQKGQGLININQASAKELEALPGIGAATAEKIVQYREEQGLFQTREDLKKVPSIGDGKFKKLEDKITL